MKSRTGRILCVAACVVLALAVPVQAQDTDNHFTGSWIHYLNATGAGSGPFLPALLTYHSDGTMVASSGLMFGSPAMPYAPIRYSPIHAAWEKVGPQAVAVTSYFFVFDPEGRIVGYARNRAVFELGADRDTYSGKLLLEQLPCGASGVFSCPDPLDPEAEWIPNPNMPAGGYQVIGKRVKIVAYPE